jgi:hypothetical protein
MKSSVISCQNSLVAAEGRAGSFAYFVVTSFLSKRLLKAAHSDDPLKRIPPAGQCVVPNWRPLMQGRALPDRYNCVKPRIWLAHLDRAESRQI